ncbi:MAG: PASTA domain-containing protein [Spirochaetaceae bacterium]|jgi:cell division protein FtsI (penicillin-binding protein 3)|nr:PASTA domain-containing protein [Spirochaetaceae bacterium]
MSFTADPKQLNRRFFFMALLLSAASLYILIRYFIIMISPPGTDFFSAAKPTAERGAILDRNGRFLALQTRLGNISVWRPDISDPQALAGELAPILELSAREIQETIENSASDFLYLKKQVEQSVVQRIQGLRSQGRLRGVSIEPVLGRIYPEKTLAAQIIGFTGNNNTGLAGVEYSFDGELSPQGGKNGNQVILTIDTNIQYILEDIAGRTLEENKAEAVMLLAMDPRTGDVLGSASLPGFDPNSIQDSDEISRMDRPSIWAYEPGSVFKVFTISALLDSGAITPDTIFFCNGQYTRGDRIVIKCLQAHGNVNARDIIVFSCNAGAAYASDRMGTGLFHRALENFGFGSRTGAGTPGETTGFLRPVNQWSERSKPTIAMGQEVAVSAFQMIQAASAVANDGILIPPRVVSRIVSDDGKTIREYRNAEPRRILSAETARAMRSYMEEGTLDLGIGRFARIRDIALAVKTGTAQVIDPETRAYSETDYIASCLALLPAENPSLVLYMVIVKPRGDYYFGSRTAAPGIRETAEALIDYLGIPRGRNPQVSHSGAVSIPAEEVISIGDRIPDFTGIAKRSLAPLLLRDDIHLDIRGEGWVVRQTPPPGTAYQKGMTITLELE